MQKPRGGFHRGGCGEQCPMFKESGKIQTSGTHWIWWREAKAVSEERLERKAQCDGGAVVKGQKRERGQEYWKGRGRRTQGQGMVL